MRECAAGFPGLGTGVAGFEVDYFLNRLRLLLDMGSRPGLTWSARSLPRQANALVTISAKGTRVCFSSTNIARLPSRADAFPVRGPCAWFTLLTACGFAGDHAAVFFSSDILTFAE